MAQGSEPVTSLEWIPSQFTLLFDRVFGERHLTLKCFFRSCGASLAAILALFLLLAAFGEVAVTDLLMLNVEEIVVLALISNFLGDYISLLETRRLMEWSFRRGSVMPVLLLDAVLTASIFLLLFWAAVNLLLLEDAYLSWSESPRLHRGPFDSCRVGIQAIATDSKGAGSFLSLEKGQSSMFTT